MAPWGAARILWTPGMAPFILMLLPCIACLPLKSDRQSSEDDHYYVNPKNIPCLRCPPGTYIKDHCIVSDSMGICLSCPAGTYMDHASGLTHCLSCTICRDDQDEDSACERAKNTVCRCKKGTYCPPNQPCEICMNCTPSCPDDQSMQAPCNSTSDIQCGTSSVDADLKIVIIPCVLIGLLIVGVGIGVWLYLKRKIPRTGNKLVEILSVCKSNEIEEENVDAQLLPTNFMLQFKEGTDPDTKEQTMYRIFDTVVDRVPPKEFDRFMRKLGLNSNEIDRAKMNNPGDVRGQSYEMLKTRHQQNPLDMNYILHSLRKLNMENAANDIREEILKEPCIQQPSS